MPALVGVVVPAFNAGAFLAETLLSVQAQTHQEWVCVVVDDGSTDDTAEVATGFADRDPRITLLRQDNAGVASARNVGVGALRSDARLLAFLDADDTWVPEALEVLVATLGRAADAVGAYGLAEYMDVAGRPVFPGAHPQAQRDRRRLGRMDLGPVDPGAATTFSTLIVSGTIWPSAVALHRRDVAEQVGLFDPAQRSVEDWDFYLRASRLGSYVPVERQVAWYRRHEHNLTLQAHTLAYFHARVHWKAWASPQNSRAQRREVVQVWRRLAVRRVWWCVGAAVQEARRRRWPEAAAAAAAARHFTRQLCANRPAEPDDRTADLAVRYVVARAAGSGSVTLSSVRRAL